MTKEICENCGKEIEEEMEIDVDGDDTSEGEEKRYVCSDECLNELLGEIK